MDMPILRFDSASDRLRRMIRCFDTVEAELDWAGGVATAAQFRSWWWSEDACRRTPSVERWLSVDPVLEQGAT